MSKVQNEGYEILRVLCGSRAYGLNTPESDYDYHSIYVIPTSRLLSIGPKIKASSSVGDSEDNTAWELQHFLELAIGGNPTIIETFVAPVVPIPQALPPLNLEMYSLGEELRGLFPYVLSRTKIYNSFRGYASSQMHKATVRETHIRRQSKAAIAYLRTMYHGVQLLDRGTYETMLPKFMLEACFYYKNYEDWKLFPFEHFRRNVEMAEEMLKSSYEDSTMQEEPNMNVINDFLLQVRKNTW